MVFSSADYDEAAQAASAGAEELHRAVENEGFKGVEIYGPSEAPIAKIQGRHRWRLWLKCDRAEELIPVLARVMKKTKSKTGADLSVTVDINPNSMN